MKKKKEVRTILPDSIMEQIADISEKELIKKKVPYHRDGTKFMVKLKDQGSVLKAQRRANAKLLKDGVLTMEMLLADHNANFGN